MEFDRKSKDLSLKLNFKYFVDFGASENIFFTNFLPEFLLNLTNALPFKTLAYAVKSRVLHTSSYAWKIRLSGKVKLEKNSSGLVGD